MDQSLCLYLTSLIRVFNSVTKFFTFTSTSCEVPLGSALQLLLIYCIQTVHYDLFLYVDINYLVYQHRDVKENEQNIRKMFSNSFD